MEGESALSLVARLASRPVLFKNHPVFQEDGLKFKEIVEVSGEAGSGKTLLLSDLITSCVLPKSYGGSEAEVILIDCDSQFNIFQLASMLESSMLDKLKSNPNLKETNTNSNPRNVIEDSLKRLNIFTCSDLETLLLQFHFFKTYLISNANIGVIMMDNISSFYWREIQFGKELRRMDTYITHILNYLHTQLSSFNVGVIYTKPSYFQSKNTSQRDSSSCYNLKNVNTLVNLSFARKEEVTLYTAQIKKSSNTYSKTFNVINDGQILWL